MKELTVCNQTIQLFPERAAFWKEEKALIVADIHIGKTSTMQNYGLAIPEGTMENDLRKLKNLILSTNAKKCIIVGDLIHTKTGLSPRVQEYFKKWVNESNCIVELIIGNHDKALIKALPTDWNLEIHQEVIKIGPFCFSHFPKPESGYFVWSGHIHPVFLVKSSFDKITLRCFHFEKNQAILPAFSDFVGGSYVKKTITSQIFVIADDEIILV